ncbi:MAG: BPSS1780 family membrane protein [Betaproteobacteria bacterium]|nr:BPSS1780 family membrane protein [Betaproteobacteria bacterium]
MQLRRDLSPRQVAAVDGWLWIREGFRLFRKSPLVWVASFFVCVVAAYLATLIPFVGPLLVELLSPVVIAGFMMGCWALAQGEPTLRPRHLLAGFQGGGGQLVAVGGAYLVGMIVISKLVALMGGSELERFTAFKTGAELFAALNAASWTHLVRGLLLPALALLLLEIPLAMATWFAPALVLFDGQDALTAMKLSFRGCLRNIPAFLLYGVISFACTVLAMITGILLLVLGPVLIGSFYAGYCDVFGVPERPSPELEAARRVTPG